MKKRQLTGKADCKKSRLVRALSVGAALVFGLTDLIPGGVARADYNAATAGELGTYAIDRADAYTLSVGDTVSITVPVVVEEHAGVVTYTEEDLALGANTPVQVADPFDENAPLNILIADVRDYVNVRNAPSTKTGKIVGKLYDGCVGIVLAEEDGWCLIQSGNCEGYVSAEYCITGEEAQALYAEAVQKIVTVNAEALNVRSGPGTDYEILKKLGRNKTAIVLEVMDEWIKIVCGTKEGYVSRDYVTISYSYDTAETLEEEKARKKAEQKAAEEKKKAEEAAKKKAEEEKKKQQEKDTPSKSEELSANPGTKKDYPNWSSMTSYEKGVAIAEYALQFEGNPYVWGGTSLTKGADCSGFVLALYRDFGVSLPHSANADQKQGTKVDGLANAQPGDLVCYKGHVGMYIGNGKIIHASTRKTGIKISNADYKKIVAIRRIF